MMLTEIFKEVLSLSISASVLVVLILVSKALFKNKLTAQWHHYIWFLLILRLLVPYAPESSLSALNILNPAIQEISNINITGNSFVFTVPESNPGSLIKASSTPGVPYNESTPNSRANTFPQKSSLSFVDLLGIAWLIGAIMIVLYLVLVYASNVLELNNGNNCSDPVIIKAIEKCKQELGIRSKILIFYSRHVNTPSMFGLINPSLLVPLGILSALSDDEKRYVLLHELSHLKRRDLWVNWLTLLLRVVYWFNPVIWYAFAKMQEDCEVACDASVLQHLNKEEHPRYGETILRVLKTVSGPVLLPVTTGMANRKSNLKRRLAMITSFKRPSWKLSIVAVVLLTLIGILGLTNSANGSLFPSRSTGKTIVEAIQKSGRNVSNLVDTENVKGGVVVFYKKAIGNGGVTNASGYIKKTLWGWEWTWGGEHSDSTPMGFSAQYFPYVKTTPFPLVFGEIKDPNVKSIDVSENGTTNKVQAKIVGTGTDLMWYVFLDKLAGPDFTITGLSNSGSILYTQSLNTNSSSSASAGVNISTSGQLGGYAEKLYRYHGTYTGDNSNVGAIVHALNYTDLPIKSFELKTDSEPYGITVNYQVDSRSNYRFREDIETAWNKNAAVMFSLIPNAGEISFRLYDRYGDFDGAYYNRENLSERYSMEYFTADTVKQAAASPDSFANFLNKVSTIKNIEVSYSELQKQSMERDKQIYSVIGVDREITPNSGVNFPVTITEEFVMSPPIKELTDQKELFAQYTDRKIDFLIYNINNFKSNNATFYLFAFDGTKMIAYADLRTAATEQNAIKTLTAL